MKTCSRCGALRPVDDFYFVSKAAGTRRGQCKECMADLKTMQKDPTWRPACSRCGIEMVRFGPGRRLCEDCFTATYDAEDQRSNGSHRAKLGPCRACGARRLRADHTPGTSLCPICRSVPQSRRTRLKLYQLTPRDFLALLEDQGYRCYVCERPFTKQRPPHVDHQHAEPMIIRGLVCATDNTILGLVKDKADRLRNAAVYLERPPAQYVLPGRCAAPGANRPDYRPLQRARSAA